MSINLLPTTTGGASALKISLPKTPKANGSYIILIAQQKVNTTWNNKMAYISDLDNNGIQLTAEEQTILLKADNLILGQSITDREPEAIEQGQYITDLELRLIALEAI